MAHTTSMSDQTKLRYATPEDAPQITEWLNSTQGNLYDPDVLTYPTLRVLCAYNGNGPSVYLPAQTALVLESLAVKPGTPPIESARAFRDLVKGMELLASSLGVKELYFMCSDKNVISLAESHGFTRMENTCLRMKL